MEEDKIKENLKIIGDRLALVLCAVTIIFISFLILLWFLRDTEEVVQFNPYILTIQECRYPFGSLFNKDSITVRDSRLIFQEKGFGGEKDTLLPFERIREIVVTRGIIWSSVRVVENGFLGKKKTLYFNRDSIVIGAFVERLDELKFNGLIVHADSIPLRIITVLSGILKIFQM